jgi:hypothetical protein
MDFDRDATFTRYTAPMTTTRRARSRVRTGFYVAVVLAAITAPLAIISLSVLARYRLPVIARTSTPQVDGRTDQLIVTVWVRRGGLVFHSTRTIDIGDSSARQSSTSARILAMSQSQWATDSSQAGELCFSMLGVGYRNGTSTGFQSVGGSIVPSGTPNERTELLYLPWWLLITMAAVPGVWLLYRSVLRPARRAARGLCRRCAYALAGITPGPCPECGWTPPATNVRKSGS